jgi:hypothetical protein
MSRGLSGQQVAAAAAPHRKAVALVEAFYDSGTLRLAMCDWDIVAAGNTYVRVGPLLTIEKPRENAQSIEGLQFTLSGIDPAIIAIATEEPYQGRIVRLLKVFLDPDSNQAIGNPKVWFPGRIRSQNVAEQNDKAVVTVLAEHYDAELDRASPARLSDAEQKRRFPGDRGCEIVGLMVERTLVWPSKLALQNANR